MADEHDEPEEFDGQSSDDEPREQDDGEAVPTGFSVDEPEETPGNFESETGETHLQETDPETDEFADREATGANETAPPPQDYVHGEEFVEEQLDPAETESDRGRPDDEEASTEENGGEPPEEGPDSAPEGTPDEAFEEPTSPAGYEEVETSPAGYDEADLDEETAPAGSAREELTEGEGELDSDPGDRAVEEPDEEQDRPETTTEFVLEPELEELRNSPRPEPVDTEPLPEVGPHAVPATLTVFAGGERRATYDIDRDQLWIGASDEGGDGTVTGDDRMGEASVADNGSADPGPEIDLAEFTDDALLWYRHATVYRQNKNYTIHVAADAATQHNDELADIGEFRRLEDGDVVILGECVGLLFELPDGEGDTVESSDRRAAAREGGDSESFPAEASDAGEPAAELAERSTREDLDPGPADGSEDLEPLDGEEVPEDELFAEEERMESFDDDLEDPDRAE